MSVNAREEEYEYVELFGKPALFTNSRIDRDTVPEGWYAYDLRGSDYDPGEPVTVEPKVGVNHAGTILIHEPVTIPKEGFRKLKGRLDFLGEHLTLEDFCDERGLIYPDLNQYQMCAASEDEGALFFSQGAEKDAELGCIGHFRFYFDQSCRFTVSSWDDHQPELKTQAFKDEFDDVVNALRENGVLKDLPAARSFCYGHESARMTDRYRPDTYAFKLETDAHTYCMRLFPNGGDYSYIYAYDKAQLQQATAPIIGKVSFASGETLAYTDPAIFVQVIKDELPYRPTSGFQYEVLTDDPQVRKAVDDILYDMFGEENPRQLSEYGLTEKGHKALLDAENPNLPHTYDWFVMENFCCKGEKRHGFSSLTDAIDHFNALKCTEKRLCVTKDDVSTIYLAIAHDGETYLDEGWRENPRFATDRTMDEAAARLQLGIAGLEPSGPTMNLGGM